MTSTKITRTATLEHTLENYEIQLYTISMNFEIAREVSRVVYIDLLNYVRDQNVDEDELRAEAFAYEGKFEQAAQTYIKMGRHESAMYS